MSLHNWNDLKLPDGMEYIRDNIAYFMLNTRKKLDYRATELLRYIDQATYVDSDIFNDRFGRGLYWSNLSTGGMTVLNVFYNPEVCFDCKEAGDNAHATINSMIKDGNVMHCMYWVLGPDYANSIDIMKGNDTTQRYTNISDYAESCDVGRYGDPPEEEEEWY